MKICIDTFRCSRAVPAKAQACRVAQRLAPGERRCRAVTQQQRPPLTARLGCKQSFEMRRTGAAGGIGAALAGGLEAGGALCSMAGMPPPLSMLSTVSGLMLFLWRIILI